MISKKLLSEVLGRNVSKVSIPVIENSIHIEFDDVFSTFINIYELAHKCKEWAVGNGLLEYRIMAYSENRNFISVSYIFKNKTIEDFGIHKKDEINSLFKACEWILEQKAI